MWRNPGEYGKSNTFDQPKPLPIACDFGRSCRILIGSSAGTASDDWAVR
jgi:hypothetical protein